MPDDTFRIFIPYMILRDDHVEYVNELLWQKDNVSFYRQNTNNGQSIYYMVTISDVEISAPPNSYTHMGATE